MSTRQRLTAAFPLGLSLAVHGVTLAAVLAFDAATTQDLPAEAWPTVAVVWSGAEDARGATEDAQAALPPQLAAPPLAVIDTEHAAPQRDASPPTPPRPPPTVPEMAQKPAKPRRLVAVAAPTGPRPLSGAPDEPTAASTSGGTKSVATLSVPRVASEEALFAAPRSGTTTATLARETSEDGSAGTPASRGPRASVGNPRPPYPEDARRRGEEGMVLLRVAVTREGLAASVDIVRTSGFPGLDTAAREAIARWRFQPAEQLGRQVDGEATVTVRFALTD